MSHPIIDLIQWGDTQAKDLQDEARADFVWTMLRRYRDADIPKQHWKAHRTFLALDDGTCLDLVEKVVLGSSKTSMETMESLLEYADRTPPLTDAEVKHHPAGQTSDARYYAVRNRYRLHRDGRWIEPPIVSMVLTFTDAEFTVLRHVYPDVKAELVKSPLAMRIHVAPVAEEHRQRAAKTLENNVGWLTVDQIRKIVVEGGAITEMSHEIGTRISQSLRNAGIDVTTKDIWPEFCQPG